MSRDIDVAVVGGGAAGLTAAHFLARAGLSVETSTTRTGRSSSGPACSTFPAHDELEGRELLASLRAKVDADAGGDHRWPTRSERHRPTERRLHRDRRRRRHHGEPPATWCWPPARARSSWPSLPLETDPSPRQPFVKVNVVTDRWGATSVPGVWAAGVVAGWPSQAVVCAGSGAAVAIEIASARSRASSGSTTTTRRLATDRVSDPNPAVAVALSVAVLVPCHDEAELPALTAGHPGPPGGGSAGPVGGIVLGRRRLEHRRHRLPARRGGRPPSPGC